MAARKRVPAHRTYTPELLANVRHRYEETPEPVATMAADMGIHPYSMHRLAKRKGWVRCNELPPRDLSPAMCLLAEANAVEAAAIPSPPRAALAGGGETAPADPSAIERLEQAVLKELSTVESMRAQLGCEPLRPLDAERAARTLSSLTQTLQRLQRLRAGRAPDSGSNDDDDDMPRDIDEFRRELARRIRAFVRSRTGGGVCGGSQPPDGSSIQS